MQSLVLCRTAKLSSDVCDIHDSISAISMMRIWWFSRSQRSRAEVFRKERSSDVRTTARRKDLLILARVFFKVDSDMCDIGVCLKMRYSIRYTLPWPFDWKETDDQPVDQWIGPDSQTNPKPTPAAHGHAGRKRLPCYRWLKHMCGGQAFLTLWAENKRSVYQTHKNYIGLHSHFTRVLISLTVSASGSAYFRFPQSHWKFHRHPSPSPPILCFDGCLYVTLTRFVHEDVPPRLQNKSEGQFQNFRANEIKINVDTEANTDKHDKTVTKP